MTITYVWSELRDRAVSAFSGELPGAEIEAAIIGVFERRPALVLATIESVGHAFAGGQIRSGWAVLRKRLEAEETKAETVATDEGELQKRLMRAEQWMRAAGKHFDRESDLLDELFDGLGGDRSEPLLKPWRDDEDLRQRMVRLWREMRPEALLIEEQAEKRAEHWRLTTGARWKTERRGLVLPGADALEHDDPEPEVDLDPEPIVESVRAESETAGATVSA